MDSNGKLSIYCELEKNEENLSWKDLKMNKK